MSENLIGIDIGGTKILIVSTDRNGAVKKCVEFKMPFSAAEIVLDKIYSELKSFGKFKSVGIGIAGDIDSKNGILRFSPNLPKWNNIPLKKYFEKKLNVPVTVENDANCAAYGSFFINGKKKYGNFITVTLGTGIGGGIIIDGKLYRGSTGTAGEIGHITVNPRGPKCSCGNHGCLEAYIGTKGIIKTARDAGLKDKNMTPAVIAQLARKGDIRALKVYKKFSEYLAAGVGSLINLFNPDMISFSGGVSNNWDLIEKKFLGELKERTFKTPLKHVRIVKTKDPAKLGAIGAALLSKISRISGTD